MQSFTTAAATALSNGSFDDWYQDGKLWNPWASGGTSFWDTGNKGATTISTSNSVPTDDTSTGSGKAAFLESKYIVLKFAAGNIFSGEYIRTDGTNGVLNFGRPFTAFPSALRIHYKYTSSTIDKTDDDHTYLKGRADSCHIYIDSHVIAYAELIKGVSNETYQTENLSLAYRYANRTPKYILVVATASKYGDYFTGGTGSKLWLDDFQLIYE